MKDPTKISVTDIKISLSPEGIPISNLDRCEIPPESKLYLSWVFHSSVENNAGTSGVVQILDQSGKKPVTVNSRSYTFGPYDRDEEVKCKLTLKGPKFPGEYVLKIASKNFPLDDVVIKVTE